jgi:glycosyltransferase involved in cell wall biosynthesis
MSKLGDYWRRFRQRVLPNGSSGEQAYHRFRLTLLFLVQNRLAKTYPYFRQFLEIERIFSDNASSRKRSLYARWMRMHEPSLVQLKKQEKQSGQLDFQPLISVITPVYNPDPKVLFDTIQSVRRQSYSKWEWCIADASDVPGPGQVIQQQAQQDARLKVVRLRSNGGISANTNAALSLAKGEFVLMLDHDDLLAPDALYEIVNALQQQPNADVIYYDEDKVSENGRVREEPWFKPDTFSPTLLFSTNFLMHSAIRRQLLEQILPLASSLDGAQDWDMAFRLCELNPHFVHVPRVLYHWRRVPGSVASRFDAKPWAFEAQKRCLKTSLERSGIPQAQVDFAGDGVLRIHWPISQTRISIIIPSRDNLTKLRPCLEAILNTTIYPDYEILVVDNGSQNPETHSYYQSLKSDSRVKLLSYPYPYNFQRINNLAAQWASGEILVFLNDDTQPLAADWLTELSGWLQMPEVGIVGAKLLRPTGLIQHGGIVIGFGGHGSHLFDGARESTYGPFGSTEWYRDCLAVTGACLAIHRRLFSELGGFDEAYQVGYGDIDLCLRVVDAGKRVIYTPFARIIHHEGATRGFWLPPADVLRASASFLPRIIAGDPYFNPNLSAFSRIPAIAPVKEPPRAVLVEKILQDFELYHPAAKTAFSTPLWWNGLKQAMDADTSSSGRKILLISHELTRTGAPLLFMELAIGLQKAGYQLSVLSPADGPLAADYRQAGIPVEVISSALDDARLILPSIVKCDFVLVNTIVCWRLIFAARAMGKKVIWFIHEGRTGQVLVDENASLQQAFKAVNFIFFPSQLVKKFYEKYLQGKNYQVLPYAIQTPTITQQKCKAVEGVSVITQQKCKVKEGTSDAILNLVNVASIEHRKGQDILLKAFEQLPQLIKKEIHLYLIGKALDHSEPAYVRMIRAKAKRMPNVHLLGEMGRVDVLDFLDTCDGLIMTSRDEALPVAILEAMALGKPVLSTAVGGISEVIRHGQNGFLFADLRPETIAHQLVEFASQPDLAVRLGENARKDFEARPTLEDYSAEVIKRIEELQYDQSEVNLF